MKNIKILHEKNLIHNLKQFSDKKICAMVKSNAYGHGLAEIVKIANPYVDMFGVVSLSEAIEVEKYTTKNILICSKVEDFALCKQHGFEVFVDDELDLQKAIKYGMKDNIHLKINCGMNRFGISSKLNAQIINNVLQEHKVNLKSICTHFPCTENKRKTLHNFENFMNIRSEITQNAPICFGGSGISEYAFNFDILRLGIGMYGYGSKKLLPVMEICSFVSKIFFAKKGQFVGYGNKHKLASDTFLAVVPIGYGDGLRRSLSGNFYVKIGGKKYFSFGNICMDCFFVMVDKSVCVGDVVQIMTDAQYFAKKLDTISYEILTGFSNFRGQTLIV